HPYLHSFPTRRSSDLTSASLTLGLGIQFSEAAVIDLAVGIAWHGVQFPYTVGNHVARNEPRAVLFDVDETGSRLVGGEKRDELRSEEHTSELQSRENL